jgi:hypothetical protein
MLAAELTIFCLVSFMFLMIGGIIGWLWKEHVVYTTPQQVFAHPEMFDRNGNVIPDEILAVRFEEGYFDEDEVDEE